MNTQVLIIGGGFAGVATAQALEAKGVQTVLVDKKDYFEVTYATLRNVAAPQKTKNRARKKYADFLTGTFVQAGVKQLNSTHAILADGQKIIFDRVVIASGTRYPSLPMAKSVDAIELTQRNQEMDHYYHQLNTSSSVLIIGGGVVGVELAGELAFAMPKLKVTLAHNGAALLNGFKAKAQAKALAHLKSNGVEVLFNTRYNEKNGEYIDPNSGQKTDAEMVLVATGTLPNNEFMTQSVPHILNLHGFVRVDQSLRVIGQDNFYALGDIADVGEAKLGYLAQQQGVHLAKTIIAEIKNTQVKAYKRNPLMALIPTGQKSGIVQLPFAVTTWSALVNMRQKDLFINKTYSGFGTSPNID